ncbi:hypothetical protein OAV88_02875 [bacterium]|nr:hypothetical protein [bacterium]
MITHQRYKYTQTYLKTSSTDSSSSSSSSSSCNRLDGDLAVLLCFFLTRTGEVRLVKSSVYIYM